MVGSSIMRGASILLLVLLSGTPAVASICAALCLPGERHHQTGVAAAAAEAPHHEVAPDAHHHQEPVPAAPSASAVDAARLTMPHTCCPDDSHGAEGLGTAARIEAGAGLLLAAPVPSHVLHASVSASRASTAYGRALSPPPPVRSLPVLRV